MEKAGVSVSAEPPGALPLPFRRRRAPSGYILGFAVFNALFLLAAFLGFRLYSWLLGFCYAPPIAYGRFPQPDDPFKFLPCTSATLPPALDDKNFQKSWAALYDPNPSHWSWGNATNHVITGSDPYAGRGIYLCGFLDVPLDYTNASDPRIARLAVNKYQVSGLSKPAKTSLVFGLEMIGAGSKSKRTIVLNPGGPGGSGTEYLWRAAEKSTERFSNGKFDVLGWDPRGMRVNTSLPSISCFPADADRDRWAWTLQSRAVSASPLAQLRVADAMNNATFAACKQIHGDLPRFVSTASVARDLEQIRIALDEPELTGYLVSYGTGIGQTYANMFPDSIGRVILDGTENVRDHRLLGGFGWTALDNGTDAWNDGFLGECVAAGPDHCALARPIGKTDTNVTLEGLKVRLASLFTSLIKEPLPAYTDRSGPSLITFTSLLMASYGAMYNPFSWPAFARALYELEQGNTTLVARMLDLAEWQFDPTAPCAARNPRPGTDELGSLVICADAYDAPLPPFDDEDKDGLVWWSSLWKNMTEKSWIAGDSRFFNVLSCRHYTSNFGSAAEVYRGDLNKTLSNPVLLIAETYDPATPLRNGRRLLTEMRKNARLVVHHGYGHSSRDTSKCTEDIAKAYILHGNVPSDPETDCFADEKPYRYGVSSTAWSTVGETSSERALREWRDHLRELRGSQPWLV